MPRIEAFINPPEHLSSAKIFACLSPKLTRYDPKVESDKLESIT